jgi:amidase
VRSGAAALAAGGAVVAPARLGFDAERLWQAWLVWRRALVAPTVAAALGRPGRASASSPRRCGSTTARRGSPSPTSWPPARCAAPSTTTCSALFEEHDVLALPVAQVWPFDVQQHWPKQVAGRTMDTYHRWMEVTIYATFAGLPAISVPAGFDAAGRLPMGLQLIGRPQADAEVLRLAAGYEALIPALLARRPPAPD